MATKVRAHMNLIDLLRGADFFRAFDDGALAPVLDAARTVEYSRNQLVFAEEEPANELFVVQSGRVAIANKSTDGRESLVALMEAGDLLGEMAFFDKGPRSAEARALEASVLVAIPFAPIKTVLEERPTLLWEVVALLARRIRQTDAALADSVFLDVTGRTAKRLLEMAGDADEFVLPVTQEELAAMVGASRERVNKAIGAFVRLGWLEQADRRYRITDREQLTRRAH